jgi:hypothetical protein
LLEKLFLIITLGDLDNVRYQQENIVSINQRQTKQSKKIPKKIKRLNKPEKMKIQDMNDEICVIYEMRKLHFYDCSRSVTVVRAYIK